MFPGLEGRLKRVHRESTASPPSPLHDSSAGFSWPKHGHSMSYHIGQATTCAKPLLTSCLRDGTKLSTQGWANSAFDRTCWRASPHGADISLQTTSLGNSYAFTRNHMLRTCAFERGWGRDKKCPCGVPKVRAIFNMRLFA